MSNAALAASVTGKGETRELALLQISPMPEYELA